MTSPPRPLPRRTGRRRDRRGRGQRGPGIVPGPLSPQGVPAVRTARERFDEVVLGSVESIESRWHRELGLVEFAVEEIPLLPADWTSSTVPLATLVPAAGATPTRLVLFRRPIELRCDNAEELAALVHTVVVEQVAELLGKTPEEIDPE